VPQELGELRLLDSKMFTPGGKGLLRRGAVGSKGADQGLVDSTALQQQGVSGRDLPVGDELELRLRALTLRQLLERREEALERRSGSLSRRGREPLVRQWRRVVDRELDLGVAAWPLGVAVDDEIVGDPGLMLHRAWTLTSAPSSIDRDLRDLQQPRREQRLLPAALQVGDGDDRDEDLEL